MNEEKVKTLFCSPHTTFQTLARKLCKYDDKNRARVLQNCNFPKRLPEGL